MTELERNVLDIDIFQHLIGHMRRFINFLFLDLPPFLLLQSVCYLANGFGSFDKTSFCLILLGLKMAEKEIAFHRIFPQ